MINDLVSIGLSIDGGYYAKVNEALRKTMNLRLDMRKLVTYVREKVAEKYGEQFENCQVTENHFFRGRYRAGQANQKHILLQERAFEDELIENDVIFHYKHLREMKDGDEVTVVEKGVDVWFALETYELAQFRNFDVVVLITGDADHEMLVKKLNALKVNTILLTWNMGTSSSTSPYLADEASWHIQLDKECVTDKDLLSRLTKPA